MMCKPMNFGPIRKGSDRMAEWSMELDKFEWSALANSRVLVSNPAQVSDCPAILPGLGRHPGRSV